MLALGRWLQINGEAIYGTSPWIHQNDTLNGYVWYTCKKTTYNALCPTSVPKNTDNVTAIYAIFLEWPNENVLPIKDVATYLGNDTYKLQLLGNKDNLNVSHLG